MPGRDEDTFGRNVYPKCRLDIVARPMQYGRVIRLSVNQYLHDDQANEYLRHISFLHIDWMDIFQTNRPSINLYYCIVAIFVSLLHMLSRLLP